MRFMSIIFPEQIGKRPADKNSRAQIEHEGCGHCETEKRETKNCSSATEKTGRKVVEKRVRNLFEHKENDEKQTVLKI